MSTIPQHDYADLQPSIGDRLRIARERRAAMDQSEFAEHIAVSRGTVSNYERDKLPGGPRQRLVLNAWAMATGVTREWLETGEAPNQPEPEGGGSVRHQGLEPRTRWLHVSPGHRTLGQYLLGAWDAA